MHDSSKLPAFIALRANGWSLASIALEIDVPKSTLWDWDTKHQHQILRLKQLQLEKLHQMLLPTYEEELSKLNLYLRRVEAALEDSDFDFMSPAYLLQMALQIRGRLARMKDHASVRASQSDPLSHATGCLTRNPQGQFTDDDLVVDSGQSASDSEIQNRTKPDETAGRVENRALNINDLQQIPKSSRPVLHSQNQTGQPQGTSNVKRKQPS